MDPWSKYTTCDPFSLKVFQSIRKKADAFLQEKYFLLSCYGPQLNLFKQVQIKSCHFPGKGKGFFHAKSECKLEQKLLLFVLSCKLLSTIYFSVCASVGFSLFVPQVVDCSMEYMHRYLHTSKAIYLYQISVSTCYSCNFYGYSHPANS